MLSSLPSMFITVDCVDMGCANSEHLSFLLYRPCMCRICNLLRKLPNARFQTTLPQPELSSATSVLSRHSTESSVDSLRLCHIFGSKVLKIKAQAQEISPDITVCVYVVPTVSSDALSNWGLDPVKTHLILWRMTILL